MVEYHVRSPVYVRHDRDDELRFLLQHADPRVQIGGRVVRDLRVKAHRMAYHRRRQFGDKLLLGVLGVSEPAHAVTVEPLRCHGGVGHLMQHGGIEFHAATVDFVGSASDVELRLHGQHHDVLPRRVIRPVHALVGLYRADPALRLNHSVECSVGVHAFRVAEFGQSEPVHELPHPFGLHLGQVGLRHVVHGKRLDKRDDLHAFLLLFAHGAVFLRADLPAVLVLHEHVPIDDGEGLLAFEHVGFQVVRLLEGEEHGQVVAVGRRVELQEEGVGAGIVASAHVLGQTRISRRSAYPALLPVGRLHLLHAPDHHLGEAVYGRLAGVGRCRVSSRCHSPRRRLAGVPSA